VFQPPRCPNQDCPEFARPTPRFFTHQGSYHPKCRAHPVPRFRCRTCGRGFSRQTFRADYRDHKPHVNAQVIKQLTHGMGFRGTARLVGLSRRCLELKARKISRNARALDLNLKARVARFGLGHEGSLMRVQFDEFETYEERRNTRPVTIAVAIESETRFHFAAVAAPIRPRGKMTKSRLAAIAAEEKRFGPRRTRSRTACRVALRRAAKVQPGGRFVYLHTDKKRSYPSIARWAFGVRRITHSRTSSRRPRGKRNPLFPINTEEADMRDKLSRLRRESWLVSKRRRFLNLHLALYSAWRNWARPRFNRDQLTPAELLGYAPRKLRHEELVGWRQDWGLRSPNPFEDGAIAVGEAA
jgi:transposase-like protein